MIHALILTLFVLNVQCQQRPQEGYIPNCPRQCDCSQDAGNKNMGSGILVNCTGRNLKRFPYPMPTYTTTLILNKNRISSFSTNDFKGVQHLRILSIQGNRLQKLTVETFGYLPWLSSLDLRRNRITELQFGFLRNSPSIKVLILADNKISKLSYGTFDVVDKLEFLDLSLNNISVIEDGSFLGLKRLKTLFLNDNKLDKVSAQLFPDVFSLKSIHLDRNQITWIQPEAFLRHRLLEVLSLGDNRISHVTYSMLTGIKNLKELYLQRNKITKIDPWALTQLKNLETLYLYSNFLDAIPANIFVGLGKLKFLHLGMNSIQYIANDAFVDLRILVTLSLDSNRITTLSPRAFSGLRQVRDLQLYFNNITFVAKDTFAELIQLNRLVWDVPTFFKSQQEYQNAVGNNLHCDCNALWLKDWLLRYQKASITCQSPPALKGRPLIAVNHVDTKCEKISVKVSPKKLLTAIGSDAVFNCTVSPGATYTWTLNGSAVNLDVYHTVNPLGTLTIKSIAEKDIGQYVCIAKNAAGTAADAAQLSIGARPTFTVLPESVDLEDPLEPVIFKCSATGIPTPRIKWFKDNLEIRTAAEESSQYHITSEGALVYLGKRHYITREGHLIIINPRHEDQGSYTCQAHNSLGKESYRISLYVDLSSKCLYGCNAGGVCQPSQFTCICTEGFHKQGHQCVSDVKPTKPAPVTEWSSGSGTGSQGSATGSGGESGSGAGSNKGKETAYTSGEGSAGSADGSGDVSSGATDASPIDQESGDDYTPRPTRPSSQRHTSTRSSIHIPLPPRRPTRLSPYATKPRRYGSTPAHVSLHGPQTTRPSTHPYRKPTRKSIDDDSSGSGNSNDSEDSSSGSGGNSGSGEGDNDDSLRIKGLRVGKPKKVPVIGNDFPLPNPYLL